MGKRKICSNAEGMTVAPNTSKASQKCTSVLTYLDLTAGSLLEDIQIAEELLGLGLGDLLPRRSEGPGFVQRALHNHEVRDPGFSKGRDALALSTSVLRESCLADLSASPNHPPLVKKRKKKSPKVTPAWGGGPMFVDTLANGAYSKGDSARAEKHTEFVLPLALDSLLQSVIEPMCKALSENFVMSFQKALEGLHKRLGATQLCCPN
ncbi:hypothetical protein NDU88_006268 [Pleurodeles waltl]|uniref:Uncharacterized protein n=1 Tax=Pleurodeles waltl TaxID=8319 RepID=A0AAV7NPS4_PLEWA|nr:hypothetical protein NDU88_006268 [Pleurodeles waltl]